MIFLIRLWSSKSFWIFFICFVVIVSILGGIIGFLCSKGFFDKPDKKAIGEKYCYFYDKNNLVKPYSDVMITSDDDNAKDILKYYKLLLKPHYDTTICFDNGKCDGEVSAFSKVDVLRYIGDSSLVQIRVDWSSLTRPNYKKVGYVPLLALHDTLPKATIRK